jgi:hypothetical protein
MNKYILITTYGLIGGLLGEEIGVQCLKLIPEALLFSDSFFAALLPLSASFRPFVVITTILIFRLQGYASYPKGLLFSLAYYLPFQYKAIWGNFKQPTPEVSETFMSRVLITIAGAAFLSGVYYLAIKYNDRNKNKGEQNNGIETDAE